MDNDYLYIVATLTFIAVFFISFHFFQSSNTETDNGIKCDGDKCFIEHKQTCKLVNKTANCDGEKCI
jgi:hypothetical protein